MYTEIKVLGTNVSSQSLEYVTTKIYNGCVSESSSYKINSVVTNKYGLTCK